MKKLVVMCMTVVMMLSMSVTSFAAFVSSPTGNPAPSIKDSYAESEDCDAELIITPYSERDTLPDACEDAIENAYDEIKTTDDLTDLNDDLADLAENLDINGTELAVSDLFNARWVGCTAEEHTEEKHGLITVELEAETLKNFVGLLHYNNGEWELIDNAKVNQGVLTFKCDDLLSSPFAIVVNTNPEKTPNSGDMSFIWLWAVIALASGTALVILLKKANKKA